MNKLALALIIFSSLAPIAFAQSPPPPMAAYVNAGAGWVPLTGSGSSGALPLPPPPAALYVLSGNSWIPWTGTGGGGTGVTQIIAGANVTISPVGGTGAVTINATSTASTAFSALTGSTNTSAAMVVGTGASLAATGTGTITATSVPATGLPSGTFSWPGSSSAIQFEPSLGFISATEFIGDGQDLTNLQTTNLTGVVAPANGGTGAQFFQVSGPASTTKTYTFPNASTTVLTTNSLITVAQGGTGAGTLTGPIKGNGTGAFSASAAADIYGLWSGTCSSSTFLRGDGSCQAASGSSGFPITIGSTSIASGSTTTTIAGLTLTSPTFTTPALGTPASGVITSLTGTCASCNIGGNAATVTTAASTTNSNFSILSATSTSGSQAPATVANFTINPNTGAVNIPGALSIGSSPPTCTSTGIWCAAESGTGGTPTAGVDYMRADSGHVYKVSLNGVTEFTSLLNFSTVNLGTTSAGGTSGNLPNNALATQTANTVLGALTATTPSGLAMPSCSGTTNALKWTSGTGFGCNTISGGATLYGPWNISFGSTNQGDFFPTTNTIHVQSIINNVAGTQAFSSLSFYINVADVVGTDYYDAGIYGPCVPGAASCPRICDLGSGTQGVALTSSQLYSLPCTQGVVNAIPITTTGQYYYTAVTGTATTASFSEQLQGPRFVDDDSSTTSTNGQLPATIAIPAADFSNAGNLIGFVAHN